MTPAGRRPPARAGASGTTGPVARARPRFLACAAAAWLALTVLPARAVAGDVQFWPTFTVYTPTVDGWRASGELHARWTDDLSDFNRTVYRANGGRLFTPGLELFAGYERTQSDSPRVRDEHRVWEQVEYTARPGRWSLANRARLEQRFVDGAGATASRLRYRFRVQHPIGRTRWLFGASEEFWLHLNTVTRVARRGVDQNRVALTATRALSAHLAFEPGYLYIYANAPPPVRNPSAHVITLQVTARF